uniref:Uncharacterized protein LOC104245276 n=1 Tax=Nicotiana sylvestris TaxID=4096 RepID=A0A1U7YIT0_NICSY|nr:PREDICTED: uncharacterized protein LOC104245276 [Nicotiana sylvestris]
MEFEHEGRLLTLQGIQSTFKDVQFKSLDKVDRKESRFFMVKVRGDKEEESSASELGGSQEPRPISEVLKQYELVFGEPTQLPPFRVETNACNVGIGAVLMQQGQPIAYLSKGLATQHQSLSIYDKELLALVMAVNKWSQYLTVMPFIVKTDQKALKFLLEQKLHKCNQLKWITKLMRYDFEIEYKNVKENKAADAPSRLPLVELSAMTLSTVKTELLEAIMKSWELDEELKSTIQALKDRSSNDKGYTFIHGQLRKNGKLVVGPDLPLRKEIL